MKVVLLEDVPGKGRAGDIREVSRGYAKNFLLPRGLALVATTTIVKQVESRLERQNLEESIDREKLVELAQQIEGKEVRLKARTGAGERLFGSITAADIAEELSRAIGSVVDKKKIEMEKPLRQAGTYEIVVKLASDIKPKITVVIAEEEAETEQEVQKTEEKEKKAKGKEKGGKKGKDEKTEAVKKEKKREAVKKEEKTDAVKKEKKKAKGKKEKAEEEEKK